MLLTGPPSGNPCGPKRNIPRDLRYPLYSSGFCRNIALHAASPEVVADRQQQLTRDLRRLDQEVGRLTGAIATGAPLPSLLEALRQRERSRADLQAQLEHLDGLSRAATRWEDADLAAELAARLAEWQAVLGGQPVLARQILRKLLAGRLRMLPEHLPEGRFYRWTVPASYGRLLAGLIGVQGMVPRAGIALRWMTSLPVSMRGRFIAGRA